MELSPTEPERRRFPRIPGSLLGHVSASFVNGPEVTLVNLSRSGALIEVSTRYAMKAFVRLKLARSPEAVTIAAGTVLWSKVHSIVNGQVSYQMAVVFEKPIADIEAATGIREEATDIGTEAPAPLSESLPSTTPTESHDLSMAVEQIRQVDLGPAASPVAPSVAADVSADVVNVADRTEERPVARVEVDQRRPDDEKSRLVLELTAATARADALQAALETREQEQRRSLREQHDRYQTIIADMVKASTDQQVEMSRQRDAAEYRRAELESRIRDLLAQVQVLELRNAAHEGRHRALRQEVERLLSTLAAPVDAPVARQDSVTVFPSPAPSAHAVA